MNGAELKDVGTAGAVVRLNGVDLFVRRLGDPVRPPLVVIHGGPTWDHSYLAPAVEQLTDVAHVVLFDLPGCGRSHRTPRWATCRTASCRPTCWPTTSPP